jgi:hypothetical protein
MLIWLLRCEKCGILLGHDVHRLFLWLALAPPSRVPKANSGSKEDRTSTLRPEKCAGLPRERGIWHPMKVNLKVIQDSQFLTAQSISQSSGADNFTG